MTKNIETYQAHTQEGMLLNANESPYMVTEKVMAEILEAIPTLDLNRYPDDSYQELYEAYAQVMNLDPNQLLTGNGSDQMLGLVIGTHLSKGKTLYTLSKDFSMYDYYASEYEANVEKYPINEDGSFDIDDFIAQGKEKGADLVIFSNPNNPTGHCLKKEEILKIVDGFDCPVLIDEAYMEFSDQSVLPYVEEHENLLVTRTLSKAFGLAGLRVGFLVCNQAKMQAYRARKVPYALNSVSQKIATIVLHHYEDIQIVIQQTKSFRDEMLDKLLLFRFMEFYPSEANFIYGKCENKELLLKLFAQANIQIRDFKHTEFFRITIGSKEENEAVLTVLQSFVREMLTCVKQV